MIVHRIVLALATVIVLPRAASADISKEACVTAHGNGQDARDQGKLSLARKLFLTCAQQGCPSLVQDDCARAVDELARTLPSLSFAARDGDGADLPDTTVYVDNILTATRLDDGKPYEVDPGRHAIKFVNGDAEKTITIVVGAGEKGRSVGVTFGGRGKPASRKGAAKVPAKKPTTDDTADATLEAIAEPPPSARERERGPATTHPRGAKLVMTVGGVVAAGGITVALIGIAQIPSNCSFSTRECAATPGDPSFATASSAVQISNIGWLVGGIGATAVVGGLVWYLTDTKKHRGEKLVAPWITPDTAGLAASGRF